MAFRAEVSSGSSAEVAEKIKSELCEDWLQKRAERWGPTKRENNMPPSWTGTITTKIGSEFHYITCPGHLNGKPCAGFWCRRDRRTAAAGLHCTYGGWVGFDGDTITDVQPNPDDSTTSTRGRSLQRLRRLWAEHVLLQT